MLCKGCPIRRAVKNVWSALLEYRWLLCIFVAVAAVSALYLQAEEGSKIWVFVNSGFFTAFLGAVAGSGVILFIEKMRREEELLKDINVCIAVLSNLIGTMISIKKQNILPMKKHYFANLATIEAAAKENIGLPPNNAIYLQLGFPSFIEPKIEADIPIEKLKSLVSHAPLVAAAVFTTKQYITYFNATHQRLMDLFSSLRTMNKDDVVKFCYFFRRESGDTDTTFPDTINALSLHTDDVLWFADKSIEEITKAAKLALPRRLRRKILKHTMLDRYKHLMPPPDHVDKTQGVRS